MVLIIVLAILIVLKLNQHQKPPRTQNASIPINGSLSIKSSSDNQNLTNSQPTNPTIKGQKYSLTVNNNYNPIKSNSEPLQTNTNQLSQGSSNLQSGPNYNNPGIASQIY